VKGEKLPISEQMWEHKLSHLNALYTDLEEEGEAELSNANCPWCWRKKWYFWVALAVVLFLIGFFSWKSCNGSSDDVDLESGPESETDESEFEK
jgi:hypothetical protein